MMFSSRLSLIVILLRCTWISRYISGLDGFNLPSNRLLYDGVLHAKRNFSVRPTAGDSALNCAATNDGGQMKSLSNETTKRKKSEKAINAGTLNLVKAMAGTGILALPMGVAKSTDFKSGVYPAILLMSVLGGVSAYTFGLYGRLIHASQAKTLGQLWEKEVDKNSAWLVSFASLIFCLGCCLSYSLCLGDVSSSMARTIGWKGFWASRQFWIIILTTTILYPLCNLKSLIALAPLSLAGVSAILVTSVFIAWRCPLVNPGSPYSIEGGGQLLKTLSSQQLPKFGSMNKGLLNPSSLVLFGMAAFAYLGHFTAPDLYHSLTAEGPTYLKETAEADDGAGKGYGHDDRSIALNSFFRVCLGGFVLTTIINCLIMIFGFLTFGGNSMGIILNNFSTFDKGATACRFFTAISVVGGYPFLIRACRGEVLELLRLKAKRNPKPNDEKVTTAVLLISLTIASMYLSDAGLIIGLAGAVMGSALAYIFPSIMFLSTTNKMKQPRPKTIVAERILCRVLFLFGTFAAFASIISILSGA
mmetsp:Transcript_33703/g.79479  ORF Transcript_33703/g.79479 Transcript_33703/m.79479 type:complete len:531 (-) Transcript_33703:811-2403(-)